MIKKKILVPLFAVVLSTGTLLGASYFWHAQAASNPFAGLAASIASKFNLNATDVQNAIAAYTQSQKGKRLQNLSELEKKRLDALVTKGKITESQETAILNELSSLQTKYNGNNFLNEKNELTQWAKDNNISPMYVLPFGPRFKFGWRKVSPTPTP